MSPDPALAVMIAPPSAGKSTWCAARYRPTQVVDLDSFRAMVADDGNDQEANPDAVDLQHRILAARCRRRLETVVDATNLVVEHRQAAAEHARRNLMLTVAVVLDTPLQQCLAFNECRDRRVPPDVIRNMWLRFAETVPRDGPVPGFAVTRRVGPGWDLLYAPTGEFGASALAGVHGGRLGRPIDRREAAGRWPGAPWLR